MKLKIMFKKNNEVLEIKNIVRVSNLSSNFENDCLYYETMMDSSGKGKTIYLKDILCFEVRL